MVSENTVNTEENCTDLWCRFYEDGAMTNTREKLEIMRTAIYLSDSHMEKNLFNYWASKIGAEDLLIEIVETQTINKDKNKNNKDKNKDKEE